MEQGKIAHRRLVADTTVFHDELIRLGFKEIKSMGHGIDKTRVFKKENKYVHSHHKFLKLFTLEDPDHKYVELHKGLTVHDQLLQFFAQRYPKGVNYGLKSKENE